jgi:hypothetical protein
MHLDVSTLPGAIRDAIGEALGWGLVIVETDARKYLLTIDAVINLSLGCLLVVFPRSVVAFLGVPSAESAFYPSMLGAVLIGIGIALLVEQYGRCRETAGLGLVGAVTINLCGGGVLAVWLLVGELGLPLRGSVFLWALVLLLLWISGLELLAKLRRA